jgi:hypothetical protein
MAVNLLWELPGDHVRSGDRLGDESVPERIPVVDLVLKGWPCTAKCRTKTDCMSTTLMPMLAALSVTARRMREK